MNNWIRFGFIFTCIFSVTVAAHGQQLGIINQIRAQKIPIITMAAAENKKDKQESYPKWDKIFEDKTMQVYIDLNSVEWNDGRVSFWKMLDLYKKLKDGALSLYAFDTHLCGKKLLQRNAVVHFKGQFASGKQISQHETDGEIERIKLGSMEDVVDDYVCKLKH